MAKKSDKAIDFKNLANDQKARRAVAKDAAPMLDDDGYEILGGGIGQEMQIGEVVEGVYGGIVRTMNGAKKGTTVPFYQVGTRTLLGGVVLTSRITEGKVKQGDMLRVTRLDDAKAKKGQNPAKLYDVRVKRS